MAKKTKAYYPQDEASNLWRAIPGTDGIYLISREGDVRKRFKSGKVTDIKPQTKATGKSKPKIVHLTIAGRRKEYTVSKLMQITWMDPPPPGMVLYHKNGEKSDNHLENLGYITRHELGKRTGHKSNGTAVFKIDKNLNEIEIYKSAREAARNNYMSAQTVIDRCNHKIKSEFEIADYSFRWAAELETMELVSGEWVDVYSGRQLHQAPKNK